VLAVTPTGETELAPYLTVVFSKPMVGLGIDGEPIDGVAPARIAPEVPGSWRWLDVRTLRFEPESGRLPGATEFTVSVPRSAESLEGTPMEEPYEARFATAGPRALGGFPSRDLPREEGLADLLPTILLTFDQAVDRESALASASLLADSLRRPLRLVELADLDDDMAALVSSVGADAWVAFRPAAPLPPGSAAILRLEPGLPSREGPRPAGRAQELRFDVRGALQVLDNLCADEITRCPPRSWWVRLSNPLDDAQPIPELVEVEPAVDDLRVRVSGSDIWFSGHFRPHTSYRVELSAEVEDVFGQRLGRRTEVAAHFGRPWAFVTIPGAPFLVLDPASSRTIEVATRSLDALELQLFAVGPDDWSAFRRSLLNPFYHERYQEWPPSGREPLAQWTVVPDDGGRGYSRVPADVSHAFDGGAHHAVLVARGIQRVEAGTDTAGVSRLESLLYPRRRAAAWIQSTSFALGAAWNPEELVAWAVSAEDGEGVAGVEVGLSGAPAVATSDARGLARVALTEAPDSLLLGRRGDEVAMLPALMASVPGESWVGDPTYPSPVWFTLTDRGLYQPGEEVEAHGWIREMAGEPRRDASFPVRVDSLLYRVRSTRAQLVTEGSVAVTANGTFHLVVPLSDDVRSGPHTLELVPVSGGEEIAPWTSRQRFRVEAFRRPEYEVMAEVDLGPHLPDASFEARASAQYYDGAALSGGSVTWRVWSFATAWYPPGWSGWHFGGVARSRQWGSAALELTGETDRSGGHTLRLTPGTPREPVPVDVRIGVQVSDLNRQVGSAVARALVHPGTLSAGVRLGRNWIMAEEELPLDVVAVDLDGRVRPDAVPVVRAFLEADESRQEARERDVAVPLACARGEPERVADQQLRPLRCVLRPSSSGMYRVEADVADDEGRRSLTSVRVFVFGRAGAFWRPRTERLALTADRELYHPGDTARLLVETPFHPMRGLLIVERHGLREVRPVTIDAPRTDIRVPVHEEDAGALSVRVEASPMMGGREAQVASARLIVDVEARRLEVSLAPARDVVEPGEDVDIEVRVADALDAPAAGGEVALWVVDEAILALAGYELPDPLAVVYGSGHRDQARLLLPQRLVRWARRPLGPGIVSAEVLSAEIGSPETGLTARLEGTDHEGSVDEGALLIRDVAPGTYRLVLSRRDAVVLERTIDVPADGLDLGTLLVLEPERMSRYRELGSSVSALALEQISVRGTAREAARGRVSPAIELPAPRAQQETVDVRHVFRALAAFETSAPLDGDGRARVTVRLPDTMTRYRIFAVATHGPTRFGQAESAVTAARDLVVRASPPRVLHPGDRPELPVMVQNASDRAADVEVVARTRGLDLTGSRGFRVRLAAGAHTEVRFPATAVHLGSGELEVLAVAAFDPLIGEGGAAGGRRVELTDAVRVPVPVSPPLAPRAAAVHERVTAGSPLSLTVEMPARAHPGFGAVEIGVSTTLLLPLVDVVRGLCLDPLPWPEATAARVLGLAGIDAALESLRAADLPEADEIRKRTAVDVERLGAWLAQYGEAGARRAFLSRFSILNAIHAMTVAEEAGYTSDFLRWLFARRVQEIWEAEWSVISSRREPVRGFRLATAAYALYLASRLDYVGIGEEWIEWVATLEPADLPVEMLAWLLEPAAGVPALASARDAFLTELSNRALTTGATVTLRQGDRAVAQAADSELRRLVLASGRRSDAAVLLALLEQEPEHPLIPGLVRGLLAGRDGTREGRSHENAWVLLALGRYASVHEAEAAELTVRATLGGAPLSDEVVLGSERVTAVLKGPTPAPGGRASLEIDTEGTGSLYVRAGVRYAPLVTRETPAEERGFLVSRRFEAVDDSADVRLDPDGTWRIRAGARVRVRLTFSALARRYQVQLRDPIPGGFEALNARLRGTGFTDDPSPPPVAFPPAGVVSAPLAATIWNGPYGWDLTEMYFRWRSSIGRWATHEERRDDRMEAYTPFMLAGTYQTTYLVRATTPGTFLVPPTRVEETEYPETYGQGKADRVVVR
jgi:hypothetical protein